jgi:hypothetical protein
VTTIEHEHNPAVYAHEISLTLPEPRAGKEWERGLAGLLSGLAGSLRQVGCPLIGHIKGMLETGEESRIYFSLTTFQGPPRFNGQLVGTSAHGRLLVNVIAYGVEMSVLEDIVHEGLVRQFGT